MTPLGCMTFAREGGSVKEDITRSRSGIWSLRANTIACSLYLSRTRNGWLAKRCPVSSVNATSFNAGKGRENRTDQKFGTDQRKKHPDRRQP